MRRLRLGAAVGIPVGLYLLYVFHYAVNVPYSDDWNMIPTVDLAFRGHLGMQDLWSQYGDTRLLVPRLVFVLFARVDHYNIRHVLLFSAMLMVGSYGLLLVLLRRYLGGRLTFLSVLAVGIVWLSLADVQNSLWSFQVAWYLATFFFVVMIYVLLGPHRYRTIFFALGIVAAVAASYSIVQGFAVWPAGLICVLWIRPWVRRTYVEGVAWLAAAAITAGVYLHGFNTSDSQCAGSTSCGAGYGVRHPYLLVRYVVLLMGNFIPTSSLHPNLTVYGLLGTAVAIAAGFVVVQSFRARSTQPSPLPAVLIAFGFFFDAMIALGRFASGPAGALYQNRYTMPNLVLFTGVLVYACAHLPLLGGAPWPADRRGWVATVGLVTLLAFVVVQASVATGFAIRQGRAYHQTYETDARFVVNLSGIPGGEQGCDAALAVIPPQSPSVVLYNLAAHLSVIEGRQLSLFQPATLRRYRAKGPPTAAAIAAAGHFASVSGLWPGCA